MAKKKLSRRLIQKVANSATININRLHVIPREGKWIIRKDGAERAIKIFVDRDEAISAARERVYEGKNDYAVVHDSNGDIFEKIQR